MASKRYDLVIFDLDGTIVDSRMDIVSGINHMLELLGLRKKAFEDIVGFIGSGRDVLVKDALGHAHIDMAVKGLAIFEGYYRRHMFDNTIMYDGIEETLRFIARSKRKMALLTNRPRPSTITILKRFCIYDLFDIVMGGDNKYCMKPAACPVRNIVGFLKMERQRSLMVGDSYIDIEAGKRAAIQTCAVTYGIGKLSEIKRSNPNYIIDDIRKLRKIL